MAAKSNTRIIVGILGVLAIAIGGGVYVMNSMKPVERDITGMVTGIDPAKGQATLEIIHPKTGKPIALTGTVAPDCVITRDGESIALADINVGDKVWAMGKLYRMTMSVVATEVKVLEPAATESTDPNAATAAQTPDAAQS